MTFLGAFNILVKLSFCFDSSYGVKFFSLILLTSILGMSGNIMVLTSKNGRSSHLTSSYRSDNQDLQNSCKYKEFSIIFDLNFRLDIHTEVSVIKARSLFGFIKR
uniref:Uncharacterized protein n=1 Tax=Glossina pallidipes TaxID=7398 RepID=A0A1A9ZMG4_GLOPL